MRANANGADGDNGTDGWGFFPNDAALLSRTVVLDMITVPSVHPPVAGWGDFQHARNVVAVAG
jgi:hypothetical protein